MLSLKDLLVVPQPPPEDNRVQDIDQAHHDALQVCLLIENAERLQAELAEAIEQDRREKAKGRKQVPRRLPTVPPVFERWQGSFYGIPDNWADDLKPAPLKIRYLPQREEPFSAMRVLQHPKEEDDSIWVKRGGTCKCPSRKLIGTQHPYWAPCWKPRMVKLERQEKWLLTVAVWKRDRRKAWGGDWVDPEDGVRVQIHYIYPHPLKKIYSEVMTEDDRKAQVEITKQKWSPWVSKPAPKVVRKPEASLALIRSVRFLRKQLMSLKQYITPPVNNWQEVTSN